MAVDTKLAETLGAQGWIFTEGSGVTGPRAQHGEADSRDDLYLRCDREQRVVTIGTHNVASVRDAPSGRATIEIDIAGQRGPQLGRRVAGGGFEIVWGLDDFARLGASARPIVIGGADGRRSDPIPVQPLLARFTAACGGW